MKWETFRDAIIARNPKLKDPDAVMTISGKSFLALLKQAHEQGDKCEKERASQIDDVLGKANPFSDLFK